MPNNFSNNTNARIGLDPRAPDVRVQQATVNLFADMGVQPATLQGDLAASTASTDREPPVSAITAPADGARVSAGERRIEGTARDQGGGRVAAVEVSFGGGTRWHPASGRERFAIAWTPPAPRRYRVRCRAVDDSGNLEGAGEGISVTVGELVRRPRCDGAAGSPPGEVYLEAAGQVEKDPLLSVWRTSPSTGTCPTRRTPAP